VPLHRLTNLQLSKKTEDLGRVELVGIIAFVLVDWKIFDTFF